MRAGIQPRRDAIVQHVLKPLLLAHHDAENIRSVNVFGLSETAKHLSEKQDGRKKEGNREKKGAAMILTHLLVKVHLHHGLNRVSDVYQLEELKEGSYVRRLGVLRWIICRHLLRRPIRQAHTNQKRERTATKLTSQTPSQHVSPQSP